MNKAKKWLSQTKVEAPLPPEKPTALVLYTSISTLPLCRFIDCIVDQNLYSLVITGNVTDIKDLYNVWQNILQEYSAAIGTNEYKLYISLYREVSILEIDYKSIGILVDAARSIEQYILLNNYEVTEIIYDIQKKLCMELNRLLTINCKFSPRDPAGFEEDLKKCTRRSKAMKINLDLKLIAYKVIENKNKGKDVVMDRSYFDSILIAISDYAKYEISETITVSKYCERIKRYNQYCESLKTSSNAR